MKWCADQIDGHICLENWLDSLSANQLVKVHELDSLFGLRRKRSIGERIFVPKLATKRALEHVEPEVSSVEAAKPIAVLNNEYHRWELKLQASIDAAEARLKAMLERALEHQAMRLEQLAQSVGASADRSLSANHVSEVSVSQKEHSIVRVNRLTDEALDALTVRFEHIMEEHAKIDAQPLLCRIHEIDERMSIAIDALRTGTVSDGCAITLDEADKCAITIAKIAIDTSTSEWRAPHVAARNYGESGSGLSTSLEVTPANDSDTGCVSGRIAKTTHV
eukprot:TRINITY_DN38393_c0_g1_i1.p1 TRINITY_DN38393_c0_g1~~TRINITY_DN38393_c0_g1_i1.p1  ORF type:complete len:278 (-),score=30.89 TRINITY_DN38393_c0_g1_i1:226-1059(-)